MTVPGNHVTLHPIHRLTNKARNGHAVFQGYYVDAQCRWSRELLSASVLIFKKIGLGVLIPKVYVIIPIVLPGDDHLQYDTQYLRLPRIDAGI